MADWFLILASSISAVLLLIASVYFLVHYQHPDDKNEAWFPKLTVLIGLMLSGATVLLLPLDVANNEGYPGCDGYDSKFCGGINMSLLWDIFFWSIPAVIFLLIPFMTFFYEADDGMLMAGTSIGTNPNNRFFSALKWELAVIVVFCSIFFGCYFALGDSTVVVKEYVTVFTNSEVYITQNGGPGSYFNTTMFDADDFISSEEAVKIQSLPMKNVELMIPVTIPTFSAAFMSFIGWFFFALFGGIGLISVPMDLILTFVNRPKHMDPSEFADTQMSIRQKTNELVDIGELLKIERDEKSVSGVKKGMFKGLSKEAREERTAFLEFKKAVYLLESDVEDFQASSANYANYNPLIPWLSLFAGFIASIISIAWIVHIVAYVLLPVPLFPFLNEYFMLFDGFFPLIGVLSVAICMLYLLICAVKGCFKFGIRFMMFQIHPMKVNKTYMSSFMFNVGLVLLCALPVVQLSVLSFPEYARYSNIVQVMEVQVQSLSVLSWFFEQKVFVYALISVSGLTALYLCCKPKDNEKKSSKGLLSRLRRK